MFGFMVGFITLSSLSLIQTFFDYTLTLYVMTSIKSYMAPYYTLSKDANTSILLSKYYFSWILLFPIDAVKSSYLLLPIYFLCKPFCFYLANFSAS
jgi:hypothetical protein